MEVMEVITNKKLIMMGIVILFMKEEVVAGAAAAAVVVEAQTHILMWLCLVPIITKMIKSV